MAMTASAVSSLKNYLWVVALAGSLGLLSVTTVQEAEDPVPVGQPEDVILFQSSHRMTRQGGQIPGIIWSSRDPVLDKDYPKDDQPGSPPPFTTEAPPPKLDTAPAPSKDYATPAPAPPLTINAPAPAPQGPPWKWMARDPYLEGDFTKDDQPTASPSLLEVSLAHQRQHHQRQHHQRQNHQHQHHQRQHHQRQDPKETEGTKANATDAATTAEEKTEAEEAVVKNGPSSEVPDDNSSSVNATTSAPDAETTEAPADNVTECATKNDPRASSWWSETAPEGTPCVFGVDVRDEGKHCILDKEQFGSNGWCYTVEDKSQWGSCNGHCPLQGPEAQLGKMLDTVAGHIKNISGGVVPTTSAVPESNEATTTPPSTAAAVLMAANLVKQLNTTIRIPGSLEHPFSDAEKTGW